MAIAFTFKKNFYSFRNISLSLTLGIIFLGAALLLGLVIYCISPYWHTRNFVHQLAENDLTIAQRLIPEHLLQPYRVSLARNAHKNLQRWHGAGGHYLKQVWPEIARQQNLHQLFLLQFSSAPSESIEYHYTNFPSTFRVSLGKPDNRLWLEWQRLSWSSWELSRLCFYNPQPVAEVTNCESSSR